MVLSLALLSYVSAVQPDVARVRTLLDEVDRSVARADVNDSEELQAACIVALGGTLQDALPDLFSGSVPRENVQELKDQLRKYVRARVKALPDGGTSTPARREAVEALARELTSRDTAVQLISAWLGLPAGAGGLPAPAAPGALFAGARKALAAAREKVVAQPEPKQGAAVSQLRSDAGPALDIVVELTESQLLADVGGPGAGNGQVDGGEWIHLRLVLKNRSPRPWFSTSALFDAKGGCLAMPTASPVVVAELLPGATGALDTWVYASQRCPDDARRFSLKLRDTHQGGPEGTAEVLTLGAHEVAWPSLANPRLDADAWGFSDGKELPRISPDERFEFSTGVALPGVRAQGVTTRFTLPADLAGLFRTPPRLAEAPLLEDKPGKFIPSDDADLVTVERRAFEQVVNGATGSKAWVAGEQGGTLWLAVDTELAVGDRVPAAPAAKAVQAPPAASLQPPSAEAVAKLARQSVSLVARPKSPSLPNGVVAAEGYEATFDATAFMEKYRDLVSPPPAPSPAAAEMEAPASPGEAGTKYTFRTFYALPLAPVSARPPPPAPLPPPPPPP
ncbi:MAG: hypothetical protein FJ086_04320, partial [Deltaproteobacteria bacterium]|nr:hypothetical protein [Deltaproteobacteria bacterium]